VEEHSKALKQLAAKSAPRGTLSHLDLTLPRIVTRTASSAPFTRRLPRTSLSEYVNSPEGTRQKVELFAVVLEAGGFTVGSDNQLSGLFAYDGQTWMHRGWPNIRAFGLALHADNNQMLYLAAGNGVLRSSDGGNSWRVLTDWRITEVLDVVIDPLNANHLIAATAHGRRGTALASGWSGRHTSPPA
jgi:hypothetical protein